MRFLDDLARATRSLGRATELMETTARMLGQHLGCNRCAYAQVEADQDHFELIGDFNDGVASIVGRYAFSDFGAEVTRLMRADLPYVNPDVDHHPITAGNDLSAYRRTQIQAVICVPLCKGGRFVAAMAVHQKVPRSWQPEEIALVREVVARCWESLDRIRSEEALRKANQRLSLALSAGALGDWSWDQASDAVALSERACDIFGIDRDAKVSWKELRERLHPDDREAARAAVVAAVAAESAYDIEYRVSSGNEVRWIAAQGKVTFAAHGVADGMIGIVQDVTARHQAKAKLTQKRDRIWDVSQDLLVVLGPDGVFRDVNPAFSRVLGYQASDVIGRHFDQFVAPEDRTASQAALQQAQGGVERFENQLFHQNGQAFWFSWTASPDQDGVVYANGRDVTEEKLARAKLAAAETALRQSQKMEAVGKLTSGIAHDFNNMLHGMVTAMNVVKAQITRGTTDTSIRYVDMALASAQRASALTHRLLAFSRQQPLDPKPVQADRLIESMEELLRRTIGPSIALVCERSAGLWGVHCDPNQLENALVNLVVNARDAMPRGGRITITSSNQTITPDNAASLRQFVAGDFVRIRVADTGSGMTADVLEHAFEPFFTTKPMGQGTGLGLSMIQGFVQQSGGFVAVQSEPQQGSMFDIYLPRHLDDTASTEQPGTAEAAPSGVGQGRIIQLIEDDPIVNALTAEALRAAGFTVHQSFDGPSGLASLLAHPEVQLLVTDVGLPGLNGRQVADAARASYPNLPVLFVTGYADKDDVSADRLPPAMRVLSKPFQMEELLEEAEKMLP